MAISVLSKQKLPLFIVLLSISTFLCAKAQYLDQYCYEEFGKYSISSNYESNINKTITKLSSLASTSFYNNITSGKGKHKVNALFYCRYDVPSKVCQKCVANTLNNVTSCPHTVENFIVYEECTLHYSNRTIFSVMEDIPRLHITDGDIIDDGGKLIRVVNKTVSSLIKDVLSEFKASSRFFAMKKANYSSKQSVYAIAQCIEDIKPSACKTCLKISFGNFTEMDGGSLLGQTFSPSCRLSYKLSAEVLSPPWDFSTLGKTGNAPAPSRSPLDKLTPPPLGSPPPRKSPSESADPSLTSPPLGSNSTVYGSTGARRTSTLSWPIASIFSFILFVKLAI